MKLSDVCTKGTSNIAQKDLDARNGAYPIYGASGFIKNVDFYHQEKPYIAIVKDGAGVGRVMQLPAKSSVIGTMQYIIPNEGFYVEYLAYALEHMNLSKYYLGAAIPHIYFKDYCSETLPNHTPEEQAHISHVLGLVSNLIFLRKQQLSKLDEIVRSRFIEMFGDLASPNCKWNTERLVDTCESSDDIKCGPFGTQLNKDEYMDSGVAVWEIPQINSLFLTMPTHFLTEEKAKQLDAYSIKPGDIAMSRKGNVGKCAVFPSILQAGIIHSDVLRIRVDDSRVLPLFMMHQLHYSGAVQHQIELVSSGAIMAGINVTKLKQIFVHIPPLDLQKQFVNYVEHIDKSKLEVQRSLEKLETLKKALMQKYFG